MHLPIPAFIVTLIVYGSLLGVSLGVIVLLRMFWKDWKKGELW
ncbi:MAG: hypothetical protein O2964_03195 [Verrucomicrobia bacterium]|jgi:hypothetical protein|nr:hypothetical protein [Verrucomicrobiota bacterium]